MSDHDEDEVVDEGGGEGEGAQHGEVEGGDDTRSAFRAAAESGEATIGDLIEVDEDEEEDEEFDPNDEEDEEEDEDEEEEGEEEEDEEVDEEDWRLCGRPTSTQRWSDTSMTRPRQRRRRKKRKKRPESTTRRGTRTGRRARTTRVGRLKGGAGMMNEAALGAFVGSVMTADGPTVTTVLLKADGTRVQRVTQHSTHSTQQYRLPQL